MGATLYCRFSALQRAENSSMLFDNPERGRVLVRVSVLFSEPKIPQFVDGTTPVPVQACQFQCSSASRKFLN